MSTEIDGIKALLDAHLSNLRSELGRLATNYDSINNTVQSIQRNTNVAIAEIKKDITSIDVKIAQDRDEIKAIKSRIEIKEDVDIKRWTEQDEINKAQKKKEDTLIKLQLTAIGTFITLAIATIWERLVP